MKISSTTAVFGRYLAISKSKFYPKCEQKTPDFKYFIAWPYENQFVYILNSLSIVIAWWVKNKQANE